MNLTAHNQQLRAHNRKMRTPSEWKPLLACGSLLTNPLIPNP